MNLSYYYPLWLVDSKVPTTMLLKSEWHQDNGKKECGEGRRAASGPASASTFHRKLMERGNDGNEYAIIKQKWKSNGLSEIRVFVLFEVLVFFLSAFLIFDEVF